MQPHGYGAPHVLIFVGLAFDRPLSNSTYIPLGVTTPLSRGRAINLDQLGKINVGTDALNRRPR